MSYIVSIGTAVPHHRHRQEDILGFMERLYAADATEARKLRFLYRQSGIDTRYSVIPDYTRPMQDWRFYPQSENLEPFPNVELRMSWFERHAPALSVDAIRRCLGNSWPESGITHLITVSCTGMSAPGLDLQVMELMDFPRNIFRTSVNFMGCYAAIHAMKLAHAICESEKKASVLIVCTELCSLHFQRAPSPDNVASSLLFGDGSAALLMVSDELAASVTHRCAVRGFYSEVVPKGKSDMSWEISASGFLMTLSGYVPELIEEDFAGLIQRAVDHLDVRISEIRHWCMHPGGKRILEAIARSLHLESSQLQPSYDVLRQYGNMSSATILFVIQEIMKKHVPGKSPQPLLGAAFGPGLTMETFVAEL